MAFENDIKIFKSYAAQLEGSTILLPGDMIHFQPGKESTGMPSWSVPRTKQGIQEMYTFLKSMAQLKGIQILGLFDGQEFSDYQKERRAQAMRHGRDASLVGAFPGHLR